MSGLLSSIFSTLKNNRRCAFIPFIIAGDSGLENTLTVMHTLVKRGADVIELGVPFSDPMADGKVIQGSHERAIRQNIILSDVLGLVKQFKSTNTKTAVVLMGYANPIEVFGYQNFSDNAKKSGVDGVLVVDMPPEESRPLKSALNANQIDLIFLVAPTTTNKRLALLANQVSGFVYFVALKGVTGAGNFNVSSVKKQLNRIRQYIDLPIGVGFGIKNAQTAQSVAPIADGVIVGSSLVSLIGKHQNDKQKMLASISHLSSQISQSLDQGIRT